MLSTRSEVYQKAIELYNPYRLVAEIKSVADVSGNVRKILKTIFGRVESKDLQKSPVNQIIVCGSSCMLAYLESLPGLKQKLVESKDFPDAYRKILLSKVPNDIDAVAGKEIWPLLCEWGKSSKIAWFETSPNIDNLRLGIFNRNISGFSMDPMIEIYPTWVSFSDHFYEKHGREWAFNKLLKDSIVFKGVRYMGPLHTLADKVIRYREKDKDMLLAFKELLIFSDEEKYGFLKKIDLSKIIGRFKFISIVAKDGLFLNKTLLIRRTALTSVLSDFSRYSGVVDKNVAK